MKLRGKLIALAMAVTTVALLTACGAFLAYDYGQIKAGIADAMTSHAEMIGGNCTAAISFVDAVSATATLNTLAKQPVVEAAAVYVTGGAQLAKYVRVGAGAPPVTAPPFMGTRMDAAHVEVCLPVELDGRQVGRVYVRADLRQLHDHLLASSRAVLIVLAGTTVGAYLLVGRLQRRISGPILELTAVARAVSRGKDYALRVGTRGGRTDELGELIDGFNDMLAQIQARDAELTSHRAHLEEAVASRTAELSRSNVDLVHAKERAEAASVAKTAFLANMSHEIRTPMTAILGYADVMLMPQQTMSDRIDSLQVIRRNARHLMELVNDILDVSKIEAEQMTVEHVPTDAAPVVADVASMLRPRAQAKGLDLQVHFIGAFPKLVQTDPLRLRQVLVNLVGNAVKFTSTGQIDLVVRAERTAGGGRTVYVDVRDTGIGMTAEQIGRLFKPFSQADGSMSRKFGGTGLGLTISKRLAVLMGGDVTVASTPGAGSTFTARFDVGPDDGVPWVTGLTESVLHGVATEQADREVRLDGARLLLAEDGFDNQRLLTLYLTTAGATVTLAENGRLALERLAEQPADQPFDVVLMDMQMPEMDGYSAATELRRRGVGLPVIALTAHAMSDDRARCLAAGCTDYLTKPVDPDLLLRTVFGYLPPEAKARILAGPAASAVPAPEPVAPASCSSAAPPGASAPAMPRSPKAAEAMRAATRAFVGRLPERVALLERLCAAGDLAQLKQTLHQLKGVGTGFGQPRLTELAARAERDVIAQAALDQVRADVDELVTMIRGIEGFDEGTPARAEPDAAHH
jgi:signal transduction histidine kinase/HPt (histidine-containing phosphotransfer) domain-containing protein/ActR/RegA family two-component response regulator